MKVSRLLLIAGSLAAYAGPLFAQECGENDVNVAALLRQASSKCDSKLVYKVSAVAGEQAIPELRKLLAAGSGAGCSSPTQTAAEETALAKLGDADALRRLANPIDPRQLAVVGDDRAIAILMAFLADHEFDKSRIRDAGDYKYDPLTDVIGSILDISSRRTIPDLPPRWSGQTTSWDQYLEVWRKWWDGHKDRAVSSAPYMTVSDPNLKCLARKVDWGFADSVLDIADRFGKPGLEVLRNFPPPTLTEPWGTIPGNLDAALAKLGDREALVRIVEELQHGAHLDAVRKLIYIGGADSAEALVNSLGVPTKDLENAQTYRDKCVNTYSGSTWEDKAKQREFIQKYCYGFYDKAMNDYQVAEQSRLRALAQMVKNPPLAADALPTPENVKKWKEWWARNRDTAQFVKPPVTNHE
jgi:hypothetical protein